VDDGIGKEIITQFKTTMKTNKTFYTDSNGRDFIKRVCLICFLSIYYKLCILVIIRLQYQLCWPLYYDKLFKFCIWNLQHICKRKIQY